MAFLAKARKAELIELCEEIGVEADVSMKVSEVKKAILSSTTYKEDEVKIILDRILEDRIKMEQERIKREEREEQLRREEREEKIRQEEREEKIRQEEREEKIRREEREEKIREEERNERITREAHQYELEIKKLELSKENLNQENETENRVEVNHKIQLAQITPKFDEKRDEMGLYLINFERRAEMAQVPKKDWVAYLLAVLPAELSNMLAREEPKDANNYEFVKSLILKRYKLNSEKLKQCFYRHHKSSDKSWRNYTQELIGYFAEWITEMKIETFQQLKDLIVTEQLKFRVPAEIRDHFLEEWLKFTTPYELAEKLDNYESIKETFKKTNITHTEIENRKEKIPFWKKNTNADGNKYDAPIKARPQWNMKKINKISSVASPLRSCLFCKDDHEYEICSLTPVEKKQKLKELNRCFVCYELNCRRNCNLCCNICNSPFHGTFLHVNFKQKKEKDVSNDILTARVKFLNGEENDKENKYVDALPIIKLKIDSNILNAIADTGSQISVVKSSLVPEKYKTPHGSVVLTCAFGQTLKAPLINLPVTKCEDYLEFEGPIYITCAMVPNLSSDLLLSVSALNELNCNIETVNLVEDGTKNKKLECNRLNGELSCDKTIIDDIDLSILYDDQDDNREFQNIIKDTVEETIKCCASMATEAEENDRANQKEISDSERFRDEQRKDVSLNSCWQDAKKGINRFRVIDNFLYHRDSILGEHVDQLVVPISRRKQLLELAHSSLWGGHLRKKKTAERLKYSFYWPRMKKDIDEFCTTCVACQLQAKKRPFDEVPITPVTRPDEPFQAINVDLIGPMEPNSRGHKYVLCAVDQCTRWPEALPLKTLTAKSTCDALLQIFSRTGIPKLVATDQGSNFTSTLTKEFLSRLGSSPRFSTPGHPSSNGLVERFNAVLKGMIHHTMREYSKDWDKHIPFLLWAYREIPNATTGVSPFQMLYGRRPTGPLSILKSTWTDETLIPIGQLKSVTDYLNDLKIKLEKAAELAGLTAAGKQAAYACYRNRRTRHKEFAEGDLVIVLIPDSDNKVYARWKGPATIIKRKSTYSYLVQLPDHNIKHVHANKIREFKASTNNVGVIYDSDIDFGDIENVPRIALVNPDPAIDVDLGHLDPGKRTDIIKILQKHPSLKSGVPRVANVGEHNIKLKLGSVPKKQKPFRIPEALKEEVDRQIEELLQLGLIVSSESEYAHPVVCVSKKDGSVRLCVDYRYLNAQTEIDSFPMKNSTDLIYQVSKAKYITLIDLLKGYWQLKLNPACQDLTSFVTHRGQYAFVVLPFGLRNAAATFQRTMNKVLSKHRDYAESYIDDITIYSDDWDTHLKHLDAVMTTLEEANFTVNFKKCDFARRKIKFLGHVVGSGTHEPDPEKVLAIQNLESPKTKKDVRSILGLLSYYRAYVPNFSDIARPLTALTKRRTPNNVVWLSEHEIAFEELKKSICEAPKCYSPSFNLPFIIYADASSYAVGACLAQKDDQNIEHPIAFVSKKLTDVQEKYAVIEKEAYAVIFALKKFETYIFGSEIVIVSDHNPLKFLTNCASQSPRLQRWSLALQRFHASITYRKGKEHVNADSLSRLSAKHWTTY